MTTTNCYWPIRGILLLKAPPWLNNCHHQRVPQILLIISILFLLPPAPSSSAITLLGTVNILWASNAILHQFLQYKSPTIALTPRENNPTHYSIPSTFPTSPTYHTSSAIRTPSSGTSHTPLYTHHIPIPTYT
jgi:hypothetical protein